MTLSFSTHWPKTMPAHMAGEPTYFVDKIWESIYPNYNVQNKTNYSIPKLPNEYFKSFEKGLIGLELVSPKLHTIRHDPHGRWKAGNDIHMVINNRTKNRFQFAPVVPCTGTQKVEIRHSKKPATIGYESGTRSVVLIDDVEFFDTVMGQKGWDDMKVFAQNDGFDSVEDFFAWFNEDFSGELIHWTGVRY